MVRLILLFASLFVLAGCGGQDFSPRDSAEVFFTLVKEGRTGEAYQRAAAAFRLTRSQNYFDARVRELGLIGFQSVGYGEVTERGDVARLRAEFALEGDRRLALNLGLVSEGGQWRLLEAKLDPNSERVVEDVFEVVPRSKDTLAEQSRAILEPLAATVPPEPQIEKLVKEVLGKFDAAVKSGDFKDLFAAVSNRWKYRGKDPHELNYTGFDERRIRESDPMNTANRLTLQALERTFGGFREAKVDLLPAQKGRMTLSEPPRVSTDGVLTTDGTFDAFVFQGAFPPTPKRLHFRMEWVYESSGWRLFGLTLNLKETAGKEGAAR